ncbi:hypothetical protein PPRY_a0461 [Pseudoalteromonas prydzensis ACAM 620]|nr:hypothetical protein [Pseudoalteromonas prydzensis ACAM 620]
MIYKALPALTVLYEFVNKCINVQIKRTFLYIKITNQREALALFAT